LIVELYREANVSRPRIKALDWPEIKVNFPTKLREQYSIGTRFSINGKVSQKPKQAPYLYADRNSIIVIDNYKPRRRVFAEKQETKSKRVYKYIEI